MAEHYRHIDRKPFIDWLDTVKKNPEQLKEIPISFHKRNKYGKSVDAIWLEKLTGVPRHAFAEELAQELESLMELMISIGIVRDEHQNFINWYKSVLENRELLWEVPLAFSKTSRHGLSVNKSWLGKQTGLNRKVFEKKENYLNVLDDVIDAMIEDGIIIKGEPAESNDIRRRLLGWFRSANNDEKKSLKLVHGVVSIKDLVRMSCFGSIRENRFAKPVSLAIDEISKELRKYVVKQDVKHRKKTDGYQNYAVKVSDMTRDKLRNSKRYRDLRDRYGIHSVVESNFNGVSRMKRTAAQYAVAINKWAKKVTKNKEKLWHIPIDYDHTKNDQRFMISRGWFVKVTGINYGHYDFLKEKINSVLPAMYEIGILSDEATLIDINHKRRLMAWFRALNDEQKKKIPVHANKIKRANLAEHIGSVSSLGSFFWHALQDVEKELVRLGVLVPEEKYLSSDDIRALADKDFKQGNAERMEEWDMLEKITLNSIDDLEKPTAENPFIQLQQLFAKTRLSRKDVGTSKKSAITTFNNYVEYLELNNEETIPLLLEDHLDEYSLIYYRSYLHERILEEVIGEQHANSMLSIVRQAFDIAKNIKGLELPEIIMEEGFNGGQRTTDRYRPFSDSNRIKIDSCIKNDLQRLEGFKEYKPSAKGDNPLDEHLNFLPGRRTKESLRWIFENRLNCKVIKHPRRSGKKVEKTIEILFSQTMSQLGGLHEIYKEWGVPSKKDIDFFLPYFARLSQITGMNTQSIIDLEIGDYVVNHPASGGRDCLRYWKERSDGANVCVLDLFKATLNWLTKKQSIEVKEIFDSVIELTTDIRDRAPEEIKNRLFIFEIQKGAQTGEVKAFTIPYLFNPIARMGGRYGIDENFNLARFRPTFVSELVELGVSLREVQLLLGHASIATTMEYLDRLDFNKKAREKLKEKLNKIHENVFVKDENENPVDLNGEETPMFVTPLASCRNIFDPPEHVKKLPSYIAGKPCSSYNKCLSCDNVVIMKTHLPELYSMQREYLEMVSHSRVMDTPYGRVIEENLMLLDEILNPELSDFSEDDLERAKEMSRFIEITVAIDGVVS